MEYRNTKLKIEVSYSNDDMDNFEDGRKIEFTMCVPVRYHKDAQKIADTINDICYETARNLLIANGIKFRNYMLQIYLY